LRTACRTRQTKPSAPCQSSCALHAEDDPAALAAPETRSSVRSSSAFRLSAREPTSPRSSSRPSPSGWNASRPVGSPGSRSPGGASPTSPPITRPATSRPPCAARCTSAAEGVAPSRTPGAAAAAHDPIWSSTITSGRSARGEHSVGNLRLMCPTHNALLAERDYGTAAMARHRRSGGRVSEGGVRYRATVAAMPLTRRLAAG